jgi:hypothetical protein
MPLTTILATDLVTNSRAVINDNFTYVEGLVLAYTKLVPSVGLMTLYDDTATTGVTTLTVRAGAGQSTTNLQEWKIATGGTVLQVDYTGGIVSSAAIGIEASVGLNVSAFAVANNRKYAFSSSSTWYGAPDLALFRTSAGLLQLNNGAESKWAGLQAGSIALQSLVVPNAPTITHGGTTGATTHGYKIVALLADGTTGTVASAETTNATGNATLDVTNYNIVTITAVTGATSYDIYRTTGGATQGKIGNSTGVAFNDTGLAASGSAPTVNSTGYITGGHKSSDGTAGYTNTITLLGTLTIVVKDGLIVSIT